MLKKIITLLILIFVVLLFVVLLKTRKENNIDTSKLQVSASFYPMYFFASQIGSAKVQVTNITPASSEPHDYELTSGDIVRIQNSKLLILNGVVEPWADKIKQNLQGKNVNILIAGANLTTDQITEDSETTIDPHVWLSPTLAKIESEKIAHELEILDPANSDYYKINENDLENKLNEIDLAYKTGLSNCKTRDFVTSHAAFGYLAKDYNLNQIAIAGVSPDSEPSLQKLAQISDLVSAKNIKYVFFESLVSPKLSETIANETHAKTAVLDPIEGILPDQLNSGINYLTLMQTNLQNLRMALQCK